MERYSSGDKRPTGLKPVKKIELSDKNTKLRIVLVVAALVIALVAFGFAIYWLLDTEPGWRTVEVTGTNLNCSDDFIFNYDLGRGEASADVEHREISALYTGLTQLAYKLFNEDDEFSDVYSVAYINNHANENVKIDPALYKALLKFVTDGDRYIYSAPIYSAYAGMFFGYNGSVHTESYDPYLDSETAEYFTEIIGYTSDKNHVTLEFLDDHYIRLNVSEEYLSYAEENDITDFISFMWLKNAFIIDYLADALAERGYTNGTLSSYDGFTRNLDQRGGEYKLNIYDRHENTVYQAASMSYTGPASIVYLKDYKLDDKDVWHYYESTSGSIITPHIDDSDGLYKNAAHNVVSYSKGLGCADVLLKLLPIYIAEELDLTAINSLRENGIYSIWGDNLTLVYNEENLAIEDLYGLDGVQYGTRYES